MLLSIPLFTLAALSLRRLILDWNTQPEWETDIGDAGMVSCLGITVWGLSGVATLIWL